MNLPEIEAFLEVVHTQSISKAAKVLYVTQSAISHRIKSLEEKVGCSLIERQKGVKTIRLTAKGQRFLPMAEQWIALLEDTETLLRNEETVALTIGCVDSLHPFLQPFYQQLVTGTPQLDLWVNTLQSSSVFDQMQNRQLDVGLVTIPFHSENILCHPVFQETMQMVCHKGSYPQGDIDAKSLRPADEVYMNWGTDLQAWHKAQWGSVVPPSMKVDITGLLGTFLNQPMRWCVCPASVANALQSQFDVDIHDFTVPPPNRISYYVRHVNPLANRADGIARFNTQFAAFLEDVPPYIQCEGWSEM